MSWAAARCNLLSEDAVLAELIALSHRTTKGSRDEVDVLATRVVDEFLHDATQLLEAKEGLERQEEEELPQGWYLPKPKKRCRPCDKPCLTLGILIFQGMVIGTARHYSCPQNAGPPGPKSLRKPWELTQRALR